MIARDYELWRPALIAFLEADSPWMTQSLESLRRGDPLSDDNRRTIQALAASHNAAMRKEAA